MATPLDERLVQQRAFELWQARGCPIGSPDDDWFRAKRALEAGFSDEDEVTPPTVEPRLDLPMGLCIVADDDPSSQRTPPRPIAEGRVHVAPSPGIGAAKTTTSSRRRRRKSDRV